jgi:hypothetical protein
VFAKFADKREAEAGLSDETFNCCPPAGTDTWFDYASDVGDGFASTYAVASLLAQPTLDVEGEPTQRGLLVLGGDQVYPAAKWDSYQEKFVAPYKLAHPEDPGVDEDDQPRLFALPGNHDWYDGLTSFMRVFSQRRAIGGWRTQQLRSYFAVEIAEGWWLWGIDTQFDQYIDAPQLDYFRAAAEELRGSRVIIATAKPSWLRVTDKERRPQSWQSLTYIRERVIDDKGTVVLTVTGDLHHYSRYASPTAGPLITAGGGGAYLSATHPLPQDLSLPPLEEGPDTTYTCAKTWPDRQRSRRLVWGIGKHCFPWVTPKLNLLLAAIYFVFALLLARGVLDQRDDLAWAFDHGSGLGLATDAISGLFVVLAILLGKGLWAWAKSGDAARWYGALHALVHLLAVLALTCAGLSLDPWDWADDGFWLGYAVALAVGLVGALVGRLILVAYLLLAQVISGRWHANEVFAAQGRGMGHDYKHFLRFRIAGDQLTMWVIGIEKVPRRWSEGSHPIPVDGELAHQLVERLDITAPRTPA